LSGFGHKVRILFASIGLDKTSLIEVFTVQGAEVVTLDDNDEDKLDFEADEPEN
jgi:hypothetical protein